ncbi:YbaB/EbfC family nucleoid-associated protein [Streptoalloteichus hindustanus]|uniref:YbaB/EbfC DNA-binding family protein n=1 Tax=Streptoalloteichus hindustanus TaxID=2017 RepID=A0A1M5K622_STRHI|nr:YbaB/EbfC family nucleoid-associated protein [Streptoalloteichus hindustanus]SHG48151.1 YbaB/EbfC DNA-binding family protein [Streptoalloteichus hindustanus]
MPTDHHAQVEELLASYRRDRERLASVHRALATVRESATSEDGAVTATVGPGGALVDLTFTDDAYRRHRPDALARLVVRLVASAAASAAERSERTVAELLPVDADPGAVLAGTGDLRPEELGRDEPGPAGPASAPTGRHRADGHDLDETDNTDRTWLQSSHGGRPA